MSAVDSKAKEASSNLRCNVFAGSDIGYLKGISFATRTFRNLNTVEKLDKKMGISCMCWGADDESAVYVGCKGGDIIHHNINTSMNQFVLLDHADDQVENLKQICVLDNNIVTAFHNGSVFIHKVESEGSFITTSLLDQLHSIKTSEDNKNLLCLDHNKFMTHMIATGGHENPLKIWDVNDLSGNPIFVAKNVRNDWLNLRVPVWVTKAQFYPMSDKVIVGTGLGQIRLYDPSTPQRRPVIEVKCEEYPVTALAVRPNSDFQVLVGNTIGTLLSVDLRKKATIKAFKGNKGGVTDIQCHSKYPLFSVCSADRYVRCYDPDRKTSLVHSFYVNSSLNCILFSSKWEKKDYGNDVGGDDDDDGDTDEKEAKGKSKRGNDSGKNSQDLSDGEGDELWKDMEVVKTKKRKVK